MDAMDDQWVFRGGEVDWGGAENLTDLCGREVALRLESLCGEGRALSYKRQVLRGRTDFIRTESLGRGSVGLPLEELVRLGLESVPARIPATDLARDLP